MEKIYVEENQKNNKKMHLSVSVGLSFAVAFIAMVSILFVSLSGTTFAAPDVSTLPSEFTTSEGDVFISPVDGAQYGVAVLGAQNVDTPIFCVEADLEFSQSTAYKRDGEIKDEGFIYLLTRLESLNVPESDVTDVDGTNYPFGNFGYSRSDLVKVWLKQTAIWAYIGRSGSDPAHSGSTYSNANVVNSLSNITTLQVRAEGSVQGMIKLADSSKLYKKYNIDQIVNTALTYYNKTSVLNLSVKKTSDDFEKTGNYMKSNAINVTMGVTGGIATNEDTYSITLNGAPNGTKVYGVNASNKEVDITNNLSSVSYSQYKKLYVAVPTSAIEENLNFGLTVKGKFEVYTGYYYKPVEQQPSGFGQRIITVDKLSKGKQATVEFSIVKAPDTGLDVSKIMYIVGMIVLLSGLGILYVNIKNQKQYQ